QSAAHPVWNFYKRSVPRPGVAVGRGPDEPGGAPRWSGLEDRAARRIRARCGPESRFQSGGIRRAAGDDQPAVRGVLSRAPAVLSRERRLLPDADAAVLLTPRR